MNSAPVSPRQRGRTQANRLHQVASWVQQQQQQLRTAAASAAAAAHSSTDPTSSATGPGAAWQQQFRNFRRNNHQHKIESSLAFEDSIGQEENRFGESESSRAHVATNGTSRTQANTDDFISAPGESSKQRLTPNKKRPNLPKRTTQIALRDSSSSSSTDTTHNHNRRQRASVQAVSMSISLWIDAAQTLVTSPAMSNVIHCSVDVGYQMSVLVLHTAALPITLPLQLCSNTVHFVRDTSCRMVQSATRAVLQQHAQQSSGEGSEEDRDDSRSRGCLLSLPGAVIGIAGSIVVSLIAPVLMGSKGNGSSTKSASSDCKQSKQPAAGSTQSDAYLDRLRLDYMNKTCGLDPQETKISFHASSKHLETPEVELSSFLLRVNDVGVQSPECDSFIFYVDLSPLSPSDGQAPLVAMALDRLASGALQLLSNHPVCAIDSNNATTPLSAIDWSPEGATQRLLRHNSEDTSSQLREVLLWSGRFREMKGGYGRHYGFFLARGSVPMDPLAFAQLLWDNSRTSEYNHFCLGRVTLHSIGCVSEESILDGTADTATKVIRSEMRVPIAGLTVTAICLMHMRPLADGSGYVMVSRTLDTGPAGTQYESLANQERGKHEILWGCNVIRRVPGQPHVAELTSLSQVGSSVPSFVAHKIGIMGVADFFKNVRAVASKTQ